MEIIKENQDAFTTTEPMIAMTNNDVPLEAGEIIIEEITRNHKLLHRHRLNQH